MQTLYIDIKEARIYENNPDAHSIRSKPGAKQR